MRGKPHACDSCTHRRTQDTSGFTTCTAFPEGVPAEIMRGEHNHQTPFAGDHGIQWELKPGRERLYQIFLEWKSPEMSPTDA